MERKNERRRKRVSLWRAVIIRELNLNLLTRHTGRTVSVSETDSPTGPNRMEVPPSTFDIPCWVLDIPVGYFAGFSFETSVPAVTHSAFRTPHSALPIQRLVNCHQVTFFDGMDRMYRMGVINVEKKMKGEEKEFGSGGR